MNSLDQAAPAPILCTAPPADPDAGMVFWPDEAPVKVRTGSVAFHLVLIAASAAVVLLAALLRIQDDKYVWLFGYQLPESCSWKRLYGVDCMGCGLTRSFISLAHFDLAGAWRFNPGGLVLFSGLLYQFPYRIAQLWRMHLRKAPLDIPLYLYLGWISLAVAVLFAQWLVRTGWPMMFGG